MYDRIVFDLTPTNDICVTVNYGKYSLENSGVPQELVSAFNFLAVTGSDVIQTDDIETNSWSFSWILPIELCYFIINKFDKDPKAVVTDIKAWIEQNEAESEKVK